MTHLPTCHHLIPASLSVTSLTPQDIICAALKARTRSDYYPHSPTLFSYKILPSKLRIHVSGSFLLHVTPNMFAVYTWGLCLYSTKSMMQRFPCLPCRAILSPSPWSQSGHCQFIFNHLLSDSH